MTFSIANIPAKDGTGATITGGVEFVDTSGAGTGPYIIGKSIIDPAGTNVAKVSAAGAQLVDGTATTQPISAASLPLPTGASTAAGLTTINTTLGTPLQAGGTVVVTGVATAANQTTMSTNQTVLQAPTAPAAATATKSELIAGTYNATRQVFADTNQGSLQVDDRGGLLVQDGKAIASVSVTSATTLFTVADTSGYGSISVQVTSAGTTCTITYEVSEDGTTWTSVVGYTPTTNSATPSSTSGTVGLTYFPIVAKQFRARVSTYTSGTVTVQGTLRKDPLPRMSIIIGGTVTTTGGSSEGGAVSTGLVPTVYEGRTTNKTAVTTGQYVRPIATSIGVAIQKPYQIPELDWYYVAAAGGITNTTTAVQFVAAAGAGIRNYCTGIQISNSTLGAGGEIAIRDGAAGTVIWRGIAATAAADPVSITFPTPIKGTANTLMEFVTLTASVTGALYVNAQGYQAP